ncbi:MAG: methylmalonyl Co-A mutase-associated GTPase MeaB [Syntrophobacterales bacterium]|jgi:LAO/AO transport system kinase|nr:methylmalonyl Co-A mutase-associated GTPase MeaB [Syntrophobacterales bacterium]
MNHTQEVVSLILAGDVRTAARLMRDLDDGAAGAREILKEIYRHSGRAHIIGITGSPGVGKSTLTDRLIQYLRQEGKTVGVVCVDPTSPFSGGAILGDRIRMQRHALDEGVFIRSLATRGHFGGLTASARAVITVLDAMGKDYILVETVGVGQDEVEIAATAYTTLVVTVPGMGDDIQAIKAGILEVADILVVNKADRDGASRTYQELMQMLELRTLRKDRSWKPPVLMTQAKDHLGIEELMAAVKEHREFLAQDGGQALQRARASRVRQEFLELLKEGIFRHLLAQMAADGRLERIIDDILAKRSDPYSASEDLVLSILGPVEPSA